MYTLGLGLALERTPEKPPVDTLLWIGLEGDILQERGGGICMYKVCYSYPQNSCTVPERKNRRVTSPTNCVKSQLPDLYSIWPWLELSSWIFNYLFSAQRTPWLLNQPLIINICFNIAAGWLQQFKYVLLVTNGHWHLRDTYITYKGEKVKINS